MISENTQTIGSLLPLLISLKSKFYESYADFLSSSKNIKHLESHNLNKIGYVLIKTTIIPKYEIRRSHSDIGEIELYPGDNSDEAGPFIQSVNCHYFFLKLLHTF